MKRIGIFYATISKNTEEVAKQLANQLKVSFDDVYNIIDVEDVNVMMKYDILIFGTPTYGKGKLHYLWYEILNEMKEMSFSKVQIALFCLGDQVYHSETFAAALDIMYSLLADQQREIIGKWAAKDYSLLQSPKVDKFGYLSGLVIDEINQTNLTSKRISDWCTLITNQF